MKNACPPGYLVTHHATLSCIVYELHTIVYKIMINLLVSGLSRRIRIREVVIVVIRQRYSIPLEIVLFVETLRNTAFIIQSVLLLMQKVRNCQ